MNDPWYILGQNSPIFIKSSPIKNYTIRVNCDKRAWWISVFVVSVLPLSQHNQLEPRSNCRKRTWRNRSGRRRWTPAGWTQSETWTSWTREGFKWIDNKLETCNSFYTEWYGHPKIFSGGGGGQNILVFKESKK